MYNKKIGVLGGGQLGKMLAQEASKWSLDISFLDKNADYPAAQLNNRFEKGDFRDYNDVVRFGKDKDVITIEIESVNLEALKKLKEMGKEIYPDPMILETIVDKGIQKQMIHSLSLPTAEFRLMDDQSSIQQFVDEEKIKIPFVQKLRVGGYDGRAVFVVDQPDKLEQLLQGPSLIEKKIEIQKELSVIVARNRDGEVKLYPPAEMVFHDTANLLDYQICPANLTKTVRGDAEKMACQIIENMNLVGLLAVEMFLDHDQKLWINELAPRPHNSGHHTIEAFYSSQYEQHLRALLGLSLGSTKMIQHSVLLNLVGDPHHEGKAIYKGVEECLKLDGVNIHIYGKTITKPYRKMGHATILGDDLESALEKARFVKEHFRIVT